MTLFTEEQVAQFLNCTKSALRRWRREGRGPRFVKIGRLVRYRQEHVEDFVNQNTVQAHLAGVELEGDRNELR